MNLYPWNNADAGHEDRRAQNEVKWRALEEKVRRHRNPTCFALGKELLCLSILP